MKKEIDQTNNLIKLYEKDIKKFNQELDEGLFFDLKDIMKVEKKLINCENVLEDLLNIKTVK